MSLDDEISHLQKENNHVDSQLHRMKSDVTGMETDAATEDKVDGQNIHFQSQKILRAKVRNVKCVTDAVLP